MTGFSEGVIPVGLRASTQTHAVQKEETNFAIHALVQCSALSAVGITSKAEVRTERSEVTSFASGETLAIEKEVIRKTNIAVGCVLAYLTIIGAFFAYSVCGEHICWTFVLTVGHIQH